MYTAKIENASGDVLTLTGKETEFQVVSITGLNQPPAQLNLTDIAGMDGAKFNSSKLNTRNLVLLVKINGDVEANRQNLYSFCRTKEACVFYFKNERRDVSIRGYVETVECDLFSNAEVAQISIICPYPYFRSVEEIVADASDTLPAFTFPFAIDYDKPVPVSVLEPDRVTNVVNDSEVVMGVLIEVQFEASVNTLIIQNTVTGEHIRLDYGFLAGDRVYVNTQKGQKSVTLVRHGASTNIFSALKSGSTFFQLAVGNNTFQYSADNGANNSFVRIMFNYAKEFQGV